MSKIVAMIPARVGSKRVKKKNLRYLGNEPLICHIINTAKKISRIDEIYINSPDDIFRDIAKNKGIKFYKRKKWTKDCVETNDDFTYEFMLSVDADIILLLNPTSPFISTDDINGFLDYMMGNQFDTTHTITDIQIECRYDEQPINYTSGKKMEPSQDLIPIKYFVNGIMGWTKKSFIYNYENIGYGTFGEEGKTGYYTLYGNSIIDIDIESDFELAEAILEHSRYTHTKYYYNKDEYTEQEVIAILNEDGISRFNSDEENIRVNVHNIIEEQDGSSWAERVVNTESNSMTIINQDRGEGNRMHYHPDWNEWWYIMKGKWLLLLDGKEIILKDGDIVMIPKNKWHKMTALENKSIRFAVSRQDVIHTYNKIK